MIRQTLALALCAMAASCTVKESRDICPFILDIWQQGCFDEGDTLRVQAWKGSLDMMDEKIGRDDFGDVYTVTLPHRGTIGVCGTMGTAGGVLVGNILRCRPGQMYAPLWAGSDAPVDATGERAEARLRIHRNHTRITVRIPGLQGEDVTLRIRGGCDGVDIRTQEPAEGELDFRTVMDSRTASASFLLPRMKEGSPLTASVTIGGRPWGKDLDLMEAITSQWDGFWTRKDLENATVEYDIVSGGMTVTVLPWDVVDLGEQTIR